MSEKRQIKSNLTDSVQIMTLAEFKDFAATVDPQGDKFYDAGPATPDEAKEGTPRLTARTSSTEK